MELFKSLDISLERTELISIVGGGGKTTSMFRLGKELLSHKKKVLLATTTAIFMPDDGDYEKLILLKDKSKGIDFIKGSSTGLTVLGRTIDLEKNKLLGVDAEVIDRIFESNIFDYIIVEADGSKRKPIKAPALHEPVIPNSTTKTVGVIGMDCVGKKLYEENVHRAEMLANITNSKLGDIIDERIIYNLIVSKEGIFKNTPQNSQKYIILNKSETKKRNQVSKKIKDKIIANRNDIANIIIGSMRCR